MNSLSTYDFSTRYTNLPHNLILDYPFVLDNNFIRFGTKL